MGCKSEGSDQSWVLSFLSAKLSVCNRFLFSRLVKDQLSAWWQFILVPGNQASLVFMKTILLRVILMIYDSYSKCYFLKLSVPLKCVY